MKTQEQHEAFFLKNHKRARIAFRRILRYWREHPEDDTCVRELALYNQSLSNKITTQAVFISGFFMGWAQDDRP